MRKNIAKVVLGLPVEGPFDYLIPEGILKKVKIGCRVVVPFANFKKIAYVVGLVGASKIAKLKTIESLIDEVPIFDNKKLNFLDKVSQYYNCSWGQMIEAALPQYLRKGKRAIFKEAAAVKSKGPESVVTLVHDETLDRRWDFLIAQIQKALSSKKGIIFLEPEIIYVEKTIQRIKEKIQADIAVLHSDISQKKEMEEWVKVRSGRVSFVVGTRSAIFAPVQDLGLVVINEEDNKAYKQEQSPFYHARDVALMLTKHYNANFILASQAPSVESYHAALAKKYQLLNLRESKERLSPVDVVDLSRETYIMKKRKTILSIRLENDIHKTLDNKGKVILFLNRLGFATSLRCKNCGFTLKCNRCSAGLTYHYKKKMLVCRFCNYQVPPVEICPQCKSSYLRYSGVGGEKLESEISRIFPLAKVARWDSDMSARPVEFDILIATQIILKERIECDLLGVLQLDTVLNRIDFRSSEETFGLLVRLSKLVKEKMVIQTHNPQHDCIQALVKSDPLLFYKKELKLRRGLGFPPFKHFVQIQLRARFEQKVKDITFSLFEILKNSNIKGASVLEPFVGTPAKLRGNYRWNILLKGKSIKDINTFINKSIKGLKQKSGVIILTNVDV